MGDGSWSESHYGTIAEHRGAVVLQSEPGQGTAVHLYLPIVAIDSSEDRQDPDVVEGSECILVIDDEEVVRETMGSILEKLGYRIMRAGDGEEGVEMFRKMKDEIDPKARALLFSGFAHDESVGKILREGCLGFLRKPFRRAELSQTAAKALGHIAE